MEAATNDYCGVAEIRRLIQEFLNEGKANQKVSEYLLSVSKDDRLLLVFLKGRKYRVKHAWETLRRNAEVRFNEYPEVFLGTLPKPCYELQKTCFSGLLKARDRFGRRIMCLNSIEWNPEEMPMEQLTAAMTFYADKLLLDEDVMNNGIVFIQNNDGVEWKHAREHTLPAMLRFLNVFWYAYPIKVMALYYINSPYFARFINNMMKPFLSKKLKERLIITGKDKKFEPLHEKLSPEILPKFLGGVLENREALDLDFISQTK